MSSLAQKNIAKFRQPLQQVLFFGIKHPRFMAQMVHLCINI
jgi:hypothetical protein